MMLQKGEIKMSLSEIEIHFEQMKGLSDALAQTASALRQMTDTMGMKTVSDTKAAWISDNADIFAGKEVKLMEQITETAGNLNTFALNIKEKAEQIYNLEMLNALTAKTRIYC